jgi:hypothetical protein
VSSGSLRALSVCACVERPRTVAAAWEPTALRGRVANSARWRAAAIVGMRKPVPRGFASCRASLARNARRIADREPSSGKHEAERRKAMT